MVSSIIALVCSIYIRVLKVMIQMVMKVVMTGRTMHLKVHIDLVLVYYSGSHSLRKQLTTKHTPMTIFVFLTDGCILLHED